MVIAIHAIFFTLGGQPAGLTPGSGGLSSSQASALEADFSARTLTGDLPVANCAAPVRFRYQRPTDTDPRGPAGRLSISGLSGLSGSYEIFPDGSADYTLDPGAGEHDEVELRFIADLIEINGGETDDVDSYLLTPCEA